MQSISRLEAGLHAFARKHLQNQSNERALLCGAGYDGMRPRICCCGRVRLCLLSPDVRLVYVSFPDSRHHCCNWSYVTVCVYVCVCVCVCERERERERDRERERETQLKLGYGLSILGAVPVALLPIYDSMLWTVAGLAPSPLTFAPLKDQPAPHVAPSPLQEHTLTVLVLGMCPPTAY
jgi:hypothetical protein